MAEDLTKRFYVENPKEWEKILSKKIFMDKKLEVKVIEHGIVLPARDLKNGKFEYTGGVCDNDFNFVAGFSRKSPNGIVKGGVDWTCNSSYTVAREELVQLNEDVIFGGTVMGHFGHFLVECLSRLWFVIQNPESKLKVLFVITGNRGYKSWFDDFFRLMGIEKERIIYVNQPMQCRSVTVPEQSEYNSWASIGFTKEFFTPYEAIKSRVTPGKIKKLYLTRSEFDENNTLPWRRCFNEKYFEDFFSEHGFEVVEPEKLSIEEQISAVMGADEIAATMGTLSNWAAMFCKPNVKFFMLNRTKKIFGLQVLINELFNVKNYYIIEGSKDFMYARHDNGVFLLGSNEYWKEFVADYFGEQINENDDKPYLEESLDKYIRHWCKNYSDPKNFDIWVSSFKNMCNRIIALEEQSIKNRPLLTYQTHVDSKGWDDGWKSESQLSNPLDQKRDIQAIKINFPEHNVYYSVYSNAEEGWSKEISNSEMAGTTGKRKPITGLKIRLDEADAKEFDILYRVHTFDGIWTDWAKNGEPLYSHGVKLNSLQIRLKPKSEESHSSLK
ncbi:MAG: DUF563 domain-containing protein [Selenomonadaceae bacterium]|nr:DUF563 domain-containing protein [Selenomonadaceae bacterium]